MLFHLQKDEEGRGGAYCCNKAGVNVCRLTVKNGGQMKSRWDNPHWPGKPCWLATDADIRECLLKSKEKSPIFRHVTDNCQVDVWNTGWDCCLDMHGCGDLMPAKNIEFCCPGTVFGY